MMLHKACFIMAYGGALDICYLRKSANLWNLNRKFVVFVGFLLRTLYIKIFMKTDLKFQHYCIPTTCSTENKPNHKNPKSKYISEVRGSVGSASDSWSVDTCQSWVQAPSKAVVSFNFLVLVGSRNEFERDLHKQNIACFTIELKKIV